MALVARQTAAGHVTGCSCGAITSVYHIKKKINVALFVLKFDLLYEKLLEVRAFNKCFTKQVMCFGKIRINMYFQYYV